MIVNEIKYFLKYRETQKVLIKVNKMSGWEASFIEDFSHYPKQRIEITTKYSWGRPSCNELKEIFDYLIELNIKWTFWIHGGNYDKKFIITIECKGR